MIKVPATTANLGPGFDTLGMSLSLYNYIEFVETESGLEIDITGEGEDSLPRDESNAVWEAACVLFKKAGVAPPGIRFKLVNNIPTARGLGSSAAARIGGLLAANIILKKRFSREEIIEAASYLEGHPDNVAAAMLGGFVVCARIGDDIICRKILVPPVLKAVVAIPSFELSTSLACTVLPTQVSLRDAVYNMSRACLLVLALKDGDIDCIGELMEDRLHQPYREALVPGLDEVFKAAREAGALGAALSGAGPAVLALTRENPDAVGRAMQAVFKRRGVDSDIRYLSPENQGAEIKEY